MAIRTVACVALLLAVGAKAAFQRRPRAEAAAEAAQASLNALEVKLRTTYESLPRSGQGMPLASGIRYLARRFLATQHGWQANGLDVVPARPGGNASHAAATRAAELLRVPAGLPESDAAVLRAVLRDDDTTRGFSLREAAHVVRAVEQVVANDELGIMRKATTLSRRLNLLPDQKLPVLFSIYGVLYMAGPDADTIFYKGMSHAKPRHYIEHELRDLAGRLQSDTVKEPLQRSVDKALQQAHRADAKGAARALQGMRAMRAELDGRHIQECRHFHGILKSMDHEGTGQVRFASSFGTNMQDWALLETPEYLRAVGALQEKGLKGSGPGVLIPNYVTSMNSCRDQGPKYASICCQDECELEILPRLEAAARGPKATVKQVWSVASRLFKAHGLVSPEKRQGLLAGLRRLAAGSNESQLEVHGRPLGRWLHRAFPHKCRKPQPASANAVVEPVLTPGIWQQTKHLPLDPAEVATAREHLKTRWGADGTGSDPTSFAARSTMGLDAELHLIKTLIKANPQGGPAMKEALENALNVRVEQEL
eukprot:CAMPEP_0168407310 /NCGR_PEP_ID=MMETSP0228-20121227/26096_1 /TAXON_ID=133427 /ORGANISM="Protoceratium reticulatum, Strain CCCM 535 (=CCMP 1889)" /LENGTH=538 /DNA_ID=CAMNT_0008420975 /DNA_START=86 /DNA_END=1699 /DNA_ORIENTATION=+